MLAIIFRANQISAAHKETPVPEAELKPRNFNPHPYEVAQPGRTHQHIQRRRQSGQFSAVPPPANSRFSQGPVQFPDNNVDTPISSTTTNVVANNNYNPYQRLSAAKSIRTNSIQQQQSNDYDYVCNK